MKQTDTHYYGTQLTAYYKQLKARDDAKLPAPPDFVVSCQECFCLVRTLHASGLLTKPLLNAVTLVLNLFLNDKGNNYDSKNDIHVEDIFPRLWRFIKVADKSLQLAFYEQLADILNGRCSQGRTTRLFQLYVIQMESI